MATSSVPGNGIFTSAPHKLVLSTSCCFDLSLLLADLKRLINRVVELETGK